jgi:FAD/FMN-containing dehydrogenase
MLRRSLLKSAAALPLALAVPPSLAAAVAPKRTPSPRVRPGEPGWPNASQWAALNVAVGGRLVEPVSLFAACAAEPGTPACRASLKHLRNPFFIGDQPGGTQVSGWLDAWTPQPSAKAVAARSTADVVAAVRFAREHNLRLVVKGGGHSYQGTSNAAHSLMIFTRAMNAVTLHDAFTPKGCDGVTAPVPAVSLGAGAMWIDAYDAVTTKAGRYVQGGGCTTVGVAGHIQSGGFGSCSKGFGTAAASLLEAEVVTADGVARTVNACNDPDLFWGLKGGGGGSLGVVTRVTVRTHELPDQFGYVGGRIKASSDEAFRRLIDRFIAHYNERLFNSHWGESVEIGRDNTLKLSMVCQGLDTEQAKAAWRPFLNWVAAEPGDFTLTQALYIGTGSARDWWKSAAEGNDSMIQDERPGEPAAHAWWRGDAEQVSMYLHGFESIWLPATLLTPEARPALTHALFAASRRFTVQLHFNKGLAGAAPEAIAASRDTAMNPKVLDAFALAIVATGGWPPYSGLPGPAYDAAAAHRNAADIEAATAELRTVAPRGGSYISESNYFNPDWADFWGVHAERLRAVKARYDPEGLFFVHHGVGSEAWSADGFERLTSS